LSPPRDTRSSLYLEDAATEFQVQGLELDWTIVSLQQASNSLGRMKLGGLGWPERPR